MNEATTIPIFSDSVGAIKMKGALPSATDIAGKVHNISADVVEKNLASIMARVEAMINFSQE